jgi:hypothetical protein
MSARDDAIKAAARSVPLVEDEDGAPYPAVVQSIVRDAVEDGVLAAIPVLLAPIRALHHCVPMRAVEGYCPDCNVIWPCATVRLLDQIEGGESR